MFKFCFSYPRPLYRGKDLKLLTGYYWKPIKRFYFDLSISFRILQYEVFKVRLRTVLLRNPVLRSAYSSKGSTSRSLSLPFDTVWQRCA